MAVIHGEHGVTPDVMSESLTMYLCETDRHVTDKTLCGDGLDEDDKDDFLDLLSRVSCHSIPKNTMMYGITFLASHIRSSTKCPNMLSVRVLPGKACSYSFHVQMPYVTCMTARNLPHER